MIFKSIGIVLCLIYISISTSDFAELLRKKRSKNTLPVLNLHTIKLPEMGKKLKQSY